MKDSQITWYAKLNTDKEYTQSNSLYAGTYTQDNNIQVNMQIWNNRWGTEDVKDLTNFIINIYFENVEDSALFDYCSITLNNSDVLSINKSASIATLEMPADLSISGKHNDGTEKNNPKNYINLDFVFSAPTDIKLKENDLKSLYFEIVPL